LALLALVAATAIAAAAPAAARAEAPIEGIWSFGGGQVAIQSQSNGEYRGTVVSPTTFARCVHEVGEPLWTAITPLGDGSYSGLHQWFFDDADCNPNPAPGLTAFRVLKSSDASRFLRVCLTEPGVDEQPTIAPSGASAGASYGCVDSERIAPLPTGNGEDSIDAPDGSHCLLRDRLRIRIREPRFDPLKKVRVTLVSEGVRHKVRARRRGAAYVAVLNLAKLPEAVPFTVRIRLTTVLGRHLGGKRTYSRCLAVVAGK
jgi:hypothetical protein